MLQDEDHSAAAPASYISVDEAAQKLGTGTRAIYSAIRRGQLKAIRVGNRLRLPLGQFEQNAA